MFKSPVVYAVKSPIKFKKPDVFSFASVHPSCNFVQEDK